MEGEGGMYGESHMETYITICKIESQWEFAVWLGEHKPGFGNNLEGWDGEEGGRDVQVILWWICDIRHVKQKGSLHKAGKVKLRWFAVRLKISASKRGFIDVQAGFRKGRGTRDQIANIRWIIEKAREFHKNIYFCFIDYAKAIDCVDHNKLWKILKEMGIPDHLTCLLRNLYAGQEEQLELDMEQQTGPK